MKIMHVAESAKGGVGSYLSELVPLQLAALGADNVRVIIPDTHAFQLGDVPANSLLPYTRRDRSISSLALLNKAVAEATEEFKPDVIHLHSTLAGLTVRGTTGWRSRRPRIVYCPHGWAFDMLSSPWKNDAAASIERALSRFCDRVIAISHHEAAGARRIGISPDKIDVVMNGIADAAPIAPAEWKDSRLKIMFVGRLDHQKGFDTLVDSLAPLRKLVTVRAAGEAVAGPPPSTHREDPIEYLGWLPRETIGSHLAAADLLVVPSRWEGFGLVALEAMRAGRMVIASDVGGLREIVSHGETGWLLPPDRPALLGRMLRSAVDQARERMGANGRARFLARFTAERMHNQLLASYHRSFSVAAPVAMRAAG